MESFAKSVDHCLVRDLVVVVDLVVDQETRSPVDLAEFKYHIKVSGSYPGFKYVIQDEFIQIYRKRTIARRLEICQEGVVIEIFKLDSFN